MIPSRPKTRAWFLLALVAFILLAYHGVSSHTFVYLDDGAYLFQNGWTAQGLTLDSIWHNLTHTTGGQYMPVTMISYLPLVSLFGNTAPPQLWFNVLLHAANALLIIWVLNKYTGRFWPAACVALLFALHPIHVESVAWATERKDVLFMFFGLLTLGAYANYTRNPSPGRYALTLCLFALSLLSKSMLVTMPALLILLDIWPLGRIPKLWSPTSSTLSTSSTVSTPSTPLPRLLLEKLPFAILSAAMAYITVKSTGGTGGVASAEALPYDLRIGLAINGYFDYLSSLFYPVDLCGLYPIPKYFEKSNVILRALGLLIITALGLWQFKKRPYLLIGWLWYLGTLAPVSGIMQAGNQSRADRFVYWPFLGIYIALIYLAWDLFTRNAPSSTSSTTSTSSTSPPPATSHYPLATSLLLLATLLATLSYNQVAYWADSEVFFKRIIAVTTKNPQAHSALAVYLIDKKRLPEAEEQFLLALQIDPQDAPSLVSLAEIAVQTNRIPLAIDLLQKVLALPTKPGEAASNAAFLLLQLGQPQKALDLVQECLKNKPNSVVVQTNAGIIFVATGTLDQKQQGLKLLESALQSAPGDPGILTNLGSAYANMQRFDDAQKLFVRAIESKPDDMRAYPLLAHLYKITGHPDRARAVYQAGLAIDPSDPACREGLAGL
jgi:protein O-mannosyl-transferase